MPHITRESLMTLEAYSRIRASFRTEIIAHKKNRFVMLGEHISLHFEDEKTMRYQVQEMLRAERTFEEAGIQDELDAYNPLVPDGSNWKATMMIEYSDPEVRKVELAKLKGVEDKVWVQVAEQPRVYAIADEDMEGEIEELTSSVLFLRFELDATSIAAARAGSPIRVGVDHPACSVPAVTLSDNVRAALVVDLA